MNIADANCIEWSFTASRHWVKRSQTCAYYAIVSLQDHLFMGLSSEQFSQALAMCGLAVFGAKRLQSSPLKQPQQQLAAFLTYMGLTPLPAHEQILAGDAAESKCGE